MAKKYQQCGLILKQYRLDNNLTQAQLSKKLNIHVQFVSNYERGLCLPPRRALKKILKNLDPISTLSFRATLASELANHYMRGLK